MTDELCNEKHKQIDQRLETNEKRLNDHSNRLDRLEQSKAESDVIQKNIFDKLSDVANRLEKFIDRIEALENKPAQNWEKTIEVVIAVVVTAAVTYFLKK